MSLKPLQSSLLCLLVALSACGGNDDGLPLFVDPIDTQQPTFSLAVSDAPVDGLSDVILCFSSITLTGESDDLVMQVGDADFGITANDLCLDDTGNIVPNAVGINLLEYKGSEFLSLVNDYTIEAGHYAQINLGMTDGSYAVDKLDYSKTPIRVPSNEIELNGFSAVENTDVGFTVEFDLRKALTAPEGQTGYILQSDGIRIVNNQQAGDINGLVSETLLINNLCEPLADIHGNPAAVYLYQGTQLDIDTLADNDGSEGVAPYASSTVYFDSSQTLYPFEIGFVPFGSYTVALSCNISDDPEMDDEVSFLDVKEVTIDENKPEGSVDFEEGYE
ncbi:MAG: DUF4382 domain-containing protein [Aliiglaciecola sp.]|uniref:DUF4382 domain-containing protein n=1 Tax=Aliiglaciecola sp. TaxID=1872441 RepID=UPI0032990F67